MQPSKEKEYYSAVSYFTKYENDFDGATKNTDDLYNGVCKIISDSLKVDESKFMTPCKKITMYLKYLKDETTTVDTPKKCKYINYRINDEVKKLENTPYGHSELYSKWIAEYRSNPEDMSTICGENMEHLNDIMFKKVQDLYNMYHKYNKYITTSGSSNTTECTEFTACVNLYYSYQSICTMGDSQDFCNALESFRHYYQSYIASVLDKCIGTHISLKSFQMWSENGLDRLDDGPFVYEDDDWNPFGLQYIGTNIFITFSTIILLSFFFFILYKFTPFGYWLRPRIQNRIKIFKKIYEEKIKLRHNIGHEETDSLNKSIGMKYHSVRNS
ncbi:PIR protein [Plasmodium ovale]|uniref:PIR protein n=1 Tax=Plasmodium ovale TaxID=36330 RepID=A0A1D3JEX5_PLAOA|nr:PIR protein [Plasmodium ovale]